MRDELAAAQSTAMPRSVLAAGDALAELECAMKHRSEEEGLRADIGARLPHAIQPSSRALSVGELRGIREELRQGRRGAPVLLPREAFGEKLRGVCRLVIQELAELTAEKVVARGLATK